jgi:hypothetical protein
MVLIVKYLLFMSYINYNHKFTQYNLTINIEHKKHQMNNVVIKR